MSSCTTSRDLPSNVWWLYMWKNELSPFPCDFLHIKFLLVLHLETCQAMSDDYRLENELSPLPCHFLHIKFLVLHLETCQAISDDCISDKLNYLPSLWIFTYKMSSCTTSRDLPCNVWWVYMWQTELSPLHCDFLDIKVLLVLHLETCQAMSDDCISDKLNYLPFLVNFYIKISSCTTSRKLPSNVWWLYKWQTELSPLPCDFLHIIFSFTTSRDLPSNVWWLY